MVASCSAVTNLLTSFFLVTSNKNYAVITADVINSRHVESFRRKRDAKLRPLSARLLFGSIASQ